MDYWVRCDVLETVGESAPGSGYSRGFTVKEARVACALAQLRAVGVMLPNLQRVAAQLRIAEDELWQQVVYVTPDGWLSPEGPPLGWRLDLSALPDFDLEPAAA